MFRFFLVLMVISLPAIGDWPQFRGPSGQGLLHDGVRVPLRWSESDGVCWKVQVSGSGFSSPIISRGKVWLTSASGTGQSLRVLKYDAKSGALELDQELFWRETPETVIAKDNGYASPTPITDGTNVYVSFGPNGNAAVEAATGRVLWRNQALVYHHDSNGAGSSPVLAGGFMVLSCDGVDRRYLSALTLSTGELAWQVRRSNTTQPGADSKSFSTPLVFTNAGREWLISVYAHRVSAYEPATGREVWAIDLPGTTVVPRPVAFGSQVFVCTGFPKPELWAIETSGDGAPRVLWKTARQIPAISSPVVVAGKLFVVTETGMASCIDVANGKTLWSERMGEPHSASPVTDGDRVFFFGQGGRTTVLSASEAFAPIGSNQLDSGFFASPAVDGNAWIFRTRSHLYRIESPPSSGGSPSR